MNTILQPRVSDAGANMAPRPDDVVDTAPFIFGATYRKLDLVTGLYSYGQLVGGQEKPSGALMGNLVLYGLGKIPVTDRSESFADWELVNMPTILDVPICGTKKPQRLAAEALALTRRAETMARLQGKSNSRRGV